MQWWQRLLTVEGALYALLTGVALALRLIPGPERLLTADETLPSLAAWQLIQGRFPEWWDAPGLVTLTAGVFGVLGDNDLTARLLPAVAGALLAPAMLLLSGWIGRWQALTAAVLLALSPTLVTVDRTVSSGSIAVLLTLLLSYGVIRSWDRADNRYLPLFGVGFALLLHLGYAGITGAMALVLFFVVSYAIRPQDQRPVPSWLRGSVRQLGIPFLSMFSLASTGLFLYPGGFGMPSLSAWVREFEPNLLNPPWYQSWLVLAGYELPIVIFGVWVSLTMLVGWAKDPLSREYAGGGFLALWGLLALMLYVLDGEGSATVLYITVLPLTVLTGRLLGNGVSRIRTALGRLSWWELGIAVVLLGFAYISLSELSVSQGAGLAVRFAIALIAVVLALAAVCNAALRTTRPFAVLSAVMLLGVVWFSWHSLGLGVFHHAWPGRAQTEPLAVHSLIDGLQVAPYTEDDRARRLSVLADLRHPVAWYLRHLQSVSYVTALQEGPTLLVGNEADATALQNGYAIRSYPLLHTWRPNDWQWRDVWRWYAWGTVRPSDTIIRRVTIATKT